MASSKEWAEIVASSLDWEQAHAGLDAAVKGLPANLRGQRPPGSPHSPWELLEHIRRTQWDLLDFSRNPQYKEQHWPDDYWPATPEPANEAAWGDCVAKIKSDMKEFAEFSIANHEKLTERIPHGSGQTYLRTVLVAVDHTSYHVGQLILVRRMLNAWPPS